MRKELKNLGKSVLRPIVIAFYVLSATLIAAYVVLYQFTPLEAKLNDTVLNSIIATGALATALVSTSIFLHYQPEDHPRRVWRNIMIAGWLWFLGELSWLLYAYIWGDVPVPSLADFFWVLGFVFFTFAFYQQYTLIVPANTDTIRTYTIGIWLVVFLIPAIFLTVIDSFNLPTYIEFYYPFADLAVGLAGLALVFIFRGGALMRPWIGLMVFGLSDLMYAWAEKTQIYAVSAENGNLLSLAIDTTYLVAYLILGVGYLGHWVLLRYGLQPSRK
jgi:hypothetical protein